MKQPTMRSTDYVCCGYKDGQESVRLHALTDKRSPCRECEHNPSAGCYCTVYQTYYGGFMAAVFDSKRVPEVITT